MRDKYNINVVNSEIKGLIIEKFDLWKWKKEMTGFVWWNKAKLQQMKTSNRSRRIVKGNSMKNFFFWNTRVEFSREKV